MTRQFSLFQLLLSIALYALLLSFCGNSLRGYGVVPPILIGILTGQICAYLLGAGALARWGLSILFANIVLTAFATFIHGPAYVFHQSESWWLFVIFSTTVDALLATSVVELFLLPFRFMKGVRREREHHARSP